MKIKSKKSARTLAVTALFISFSAYAFAQAPSVLKPKPKGKPWNAPEEYVTMKNPVPIDDSTMIIGKDLYTEHCKSCHGTKGKGDGTKAEKIDISCGDFTSLEYMKESDGESYWKTTEGRKPMPSFKEKMTDRERWIVTYYVRRLGKPKR
jgi:mono/diheme cytochrome c family protein